MAKSREINKVWILTKCINVFHDAAVTRCCFNGVAFLSFLYRSDTSISCVYYSYDNSIMIFILSFHLVMIFMSVSPMYDYVMLSYIILSSYYHWSLSPNQVWLSSYFRHVIIHCFLHSKYDYRHIFVTISLMFISIASKYYGRHIVVVVVVSISSKCDYSHNIIIFH